MDVQLIPCMLYAVRYIVQRYSEVQRRTAAMTTPPCLVSNDFPDIAQDLARIDYPALPLIDVHHDDLFQLKLRHTVAVPAAAVAPDVVASALQCVRSVDVKQDTIASLRSPLASQQHINELCFTAYETLGLKSTLTRTMQAWLVLVILQTPVLQRQERERVVAKLHQLSQQRRLHAAALRITALLLCDPASVRLYLGAPLFCLSVIWSQHCLTYLTENFHAVLTACLYHAHSSSTLLGLADVRRIINGLRHPPPPASPPSTVIIDSGPLDSIPQVTEQLLPSAAEVGRGQRGTGAPSARRAASKRKREEVKEEYVVSAVTALRVRRQQLEVRVQWEECGEQDDTWEPWETVCHVDAVREYVMRLVLGEDRRALQRKIAELERKWRREQKHAADLVLVLRQRDG